LGHYHRHIFKRRVGKNGIISVGRHDYYVGYQHAKETVGVLLEAEQRVFRVLYKGTILRELEIQDLIGKSMAFQDYLTPMLQEARTVQSV
jgi:hypothetical protein